MARIIVIKSEYIIVQGLVKIAQQLLGNNFEITNKKMKEILALLSVKFPEIIGYKKIGTFNLFWIKASLDDFKKWFKEWYGKIF